MSKLRQALKKSETVRKIYYGIKEQRRRKKVLSGKYLYENRTSGSKYACIILAGYKEVLWENVFSRIKSYAPRDMDICIISSGLYSPKLSEIARENGWSYLSTEKNKITLALNIGLDLLKQAEYIYKLDEDMFVTKNFFESLKETYDDVMKEERYVASFVAPLIPVNTYGYVRLLGHFSLEEEWKNNFGPVTYTNGLDHHCEILKNPMAAKFLWGDCTAFKDIDEISARLAKEPSKYSVCPIRFSIGAIFFARKYWLDMGMFNVSEGNNLGYDEQQMCTYGMDCGMSIIVDENCAVGHLAYGPQTAEMLEYYKKHNERFQCKN